MASSNATTDSRDSTDQGHPVGWNSKTSPPDGGIVSGAPDVDGVPYAPPAELEAPPAELEAPPQQTDNAGEAVVAAFIFGHLVRRWTGQPLSTEERARFVRDLQPVLQKHNVPSLLPPEEAQLASTVAEIVIPRLATEGSDDDRSVSGQEGQREEHGAPPPRAPGAPRTRIAMPGLA